MYYVQFKNNNVIRGLIKRLLIYTIEDLLFPFWDKQSLRDFSLTYYEPPLSKVLGRNFIMSLANL